MKQKFYLVIMILIILLPTIAGCGKVSEDISSSSEKITDEPTNTPTPSVSPEEPDLGGGSFETANKQVAYRNPNEEISGGKLATAMLSYERGLSRYRVLLTVMFDELVLSDLQFASDHKLKNEKVTIYTDSFGNVDYYQGISIQTDSVGFQVVDIYPISEANVNSSMLYGEEIKRDGDFRLKYEYEIYKILVPVYHFGDEDYYAEIALNEGISQEEAENGFEILKNSLHFYFQLNEEDDVAAFQDMNGNTADIGKFVFYEDILTRCLAERKVYLSASDAINVSSDTISLNYISPTGQYYDVIVSSDEYTETVYNESESVDRFSLNGIQVDMRVNKDIQYIYFFLGSMDDSEFILIQKYSSDMSLSDEKDLFLDAF